MEGVCSSRGDGLGSRDRAPVELILSEFQFSCRYEGILKHDAKPTELGGREHVNMDEKKTKLNYS